MKQYLDLVRRTLTEGTPKTDRTGTGTISLFGPQMEFNLQAGFPLVTTKQVFTRGIFEELFWLLKGSVNNNDLVDRNVHIWDEWARVDHAEMSVEERFTILAKNLGAEAFSALRNEWPVFANETETHAELDKHGIPRTKRGPKDGDLGPIYGKQWRDWEGDLVISHDVGETWELVDPDQLKAGLYIGGEDGGVMFKRLGIDQIGLVMKSLKNDPFGRRHCISAWNVADMPKMALSPCHAFFQFNVQTLTLAQRVNVAMERNMGGLLDAATTPEALLRVLDDGQVPTLGLSCKLYQRSADLMLGVPFNIASYAALTMMMAQCLGYAPLQFIHTFGDAHVYSNHIEGAETQLARIPHPMCRLALNPDITELDQFTIDDLTLVGYRHDEKIVFPVAV